MSGQSRFVRVVVDLEVEVVDITQARAFTWDWGTTPDGEKVMMPHPDVESQVQGTVGMLIGQLHETAEKRAGLRFLGMSVITRPRDEEGNYQPFTLSALPGRRDDGTLLDEPPAR